MAQLVEVKGLDEIIERMKAYPGELKKSLTLTVTSALIVFWENVPPYPPPPENSGYRRTGTLGRSLGSGFGGGAVGSPDVFQVRSLGAGVEGKFGSRLSYAGDVIGDGTQKPKFAEYWWTIRAISEKSAEKVGRLFEQLGEKMVAFLERQG
jgi:hypothetical protein